MEKITGKEVETMMEAYTSIYDNQEQEVISEETQELQENQANRDKQRELRQKQNAGRAQQQLGGKPRPEGSFRDRIFARRSSSAAARANTNKVGQNIKVGSPTGPAQNDELKKPAPTVLADKKPAQSPTSNLKPGSPSTVVSPKSGEETKFKRRLPSMAELKAAQDARKTATAGGASKQEAEYQAVKAGVNAGKPAPKPAAGGPGGYQVSADATPKTKPAAAAAPVVKKPQPRMGMRNRMRAPGGMYGGSPRSRMEELDVFDTIKEYLIGEGATEEEALKQMLALTDEQRTEIIEGSCGSKKKTTKKNKGGY